MWLELGAAGGVSGAARVVGGRGAARRDPRVHRHHGGQRLPAELAEQPVGGRHGPLGRHARLDKLDATDFEAATAWVNDVVRAKLGQTAA
mgnify:CR=1 FL=1